MHGHWQNWILDWLNALEQENGLVGRALDMLDLLEGDSEDGLEAAESRLTASLKKAQELLRHGDFEESLAVALSGVRDYGESLKPPEVAKPDVQALTRQGVSDEQICWILGWKDQFGNPDLKKLKEERRSPGIHLDTWKSPLIREFEEWKRSLLQRIDGLFERFGIRRVEVDAVQVVPVPGVSRNTWELLEVFGNLQRSGLSIRKIAQQLGLSYAKTLKLREQWEAIYGETSQPGADREGRNAVAEGVVGQPDCPRVGVPAEDDLGVGAEVTGEVESGDRDPAG